MFHPIDRPLAARRPATSAVGIVLLLALAPVALATFQPAPPVAFDQQFGTNEDEFPADLAHDAAGNSYQAISAKGPFPGQTHAGSGDLVMRKTDSSGTELWVRQIGTSGDDRPGRTVAVTPSGISAVGGETTGSFPGFTNQGIWDVVVALWDADGNQIAVDQFGTTGVDEAWGTATDGTSFFVTGHTNGTLPGQTSAGDYDCFVAVYDLNGNRTNLVQFGTSARDTAHGVAVDASGNLFVTGFTAGAFGTPLGGNDGFVVKLDSNLNVVASENYGTTANDNYKAIAIGDGGDLVVAGGTFGAIPGEIAQGWDIVVQKIDRTTLGSVWIRQLGITADSDFGEDVTVAADGTSYTVGNTRGLEDRGAVATTHGAVIALDAAGNDLWNDQFDATGSAVWLNGTSLDPTGRLWTIGYANGEFAGQIFRNDGVIRIYEPFSSGVTDITACGEVISAPGDYRLANDVAGTGVCIDVTANDVNLDLNGHDITVQQGVTPPDVGIRAWSGSNFQIFNTGASDAVIRVQSGTGIEIDSGSTVAIDGTAVRCETPGTGDLCLDLRASNDVTVGSVFFRDSGSGNVSFSMDGLTTATVSDATVDATGAANPTGLQVTNAQGLTLDDTDITNSTASVQGTAVIVNRLSMSGDSWRADALDVEADGTLTDVTTQRAGIALAGGPADDLQIIRLSASGLEDDVTVGDGVTLTDPNLLFDGPRSAEFALSVLGSTRLDNPSFGRIRSDLDVPLIRSVGAAPVRVGGGLSVTTYESPGGQPIGEVDWTLSTDVDLEILPGGTGFEARQVANSPVELQDATEIRFLVELMNTGDKEVFEDGVRITGACTTMPDGKTTFCGSPDGASRYTLGNGLLAGCGPLLNAGDVLLFDSDRAASGGQPCFHIQAPDVTVDCVGHRLTLTGGSQANPTVGFLVGDSGAAIESCELELNASYAVGVKADAFSVNLSLSYNSLRFNADETTGVEAIDTPGLWLTGQTHQAGPHIALGLYAHGPDIAVDGLIIDEDPGAQHQIDVAAAGSIRSSQLRGIVGLSGRSPSEPLALESTVVGNPDIFNGSIRWGDYVEMRNSVLVPANGAPMDADGGVDGGWLTDATVSVSATRGVAISTTVNAVTHRIDGTLDLRTVQPFDANPVGVVRFGNLVGVTLDAIVGSWNFSDPDSVNLEGDDFAGEPSLDIVARRLVTPAPATPVEGYLDGSGNDPFAGGACVVTSAEGTPLECTCDRDLGEGVVQDETLHLRVCDDGLVNREFPLDCEPPGTRNCQAGCAHDGVTLTLIPRPNPDETELAWNAVGASLYEIYRSTDPNGIQDPANLLDSTAGTSYVDTNAGEQTIYFYVVHPID